MIVFRKACTDLPNRFEPSDVLAVEALPVEVSTESAARLLVTDAHRFNDLLAQIPHPRGARLHCHAHLTVC